MENWQAEVVQESIELVCRGAALEDFIESEVWNRLEEEDRRLIYVQQYLMENYHRVLTARMERF